jgi:prevent-host-death family protein
VTSALAKYASSVIKAYNVGKVKTRLSSLLDEVQRGVEVVVAKNGKPVARVTKLKGVGKRPMGFVKGRLTRAFFEPLPDEELAELGRVQAELVCGRSTCDSLQPRRCASCLVSIRLSSIEQ